MRLRIPLAEMMHVAPTARPRAIAMRIWERGRAEHIAPNFAPAQAIRVVERMTGFVTEDAHHAARVAAFGFAHDPPFEPFEAWVREIERHRDTGYAVR